MQFNALGNAMRAVSAICSYERDGKVRLRVHSVTRSLNCCTCPIAKQYDINSGASSTPKFFCDVGNGANATHKFSCDMANGASATHEFSCDVANGASATHEFACDVAVCSSPKFFWT